MHACVCVHTHVCVCVCLVCLGTCMLSWNWPSRLDWLASKPEGSACLCFLSSRIMKSYLTFFFFWHGFWMPIWDPHDYKANSFTNWAICPALNLPVTTVLKSLPINSSSAIITVYVFPDSSCFLLWITFPNSLWLIHFWLCALESSRSLHAACHDRWWVSLHSPNAWGFQWYLSEHQHLPIHFSYPFYPRDKSPDRSSLTKERIALAHGSRRMAGCAWWQDREVLVTLCWQSAK